MRKYCRSGSYIAVVEPLESRQLLSVNVLVHHGDPTNDGENLAETVLTPSNVNPTDFGKQFTATLDAPIYAQPLYVQNQNITRGSAIGIHSVVYVATMHDSLYAIDANTGAILWQDSFLNITNPTNLTATAGVTTVPSSDLGSDNLGTALGILATPAIDLTKGVLLLNANTKEIRGTDTHFVQRLWEVNLTDGSAALTPTVIGDTISNNPFSSYTGYQYVAGPIVDGSGNNTDPTSYPNTDGWVSAPGVATTPVIAFNALIQMQRTAMTLLNGSVYLGFASHGDNGPYYGWILGYSESNLALNAAFVTTPTYEGIVGDRADYTAQGGIRASGSAIATDGTYLYVTTGNGAFNTASSNFNSDGFPIDHDYGDSLLKLDVDSTSSPTQQNGNGWGLAVADYFTPSNANALNTKDLDLGSGGVLLLPSNLTDSAGNPMLMFGGKESRVYLVDRNNLGKFNTSYPETGDVDPRLYDRVLGEYAGAGINGNASGVFSTPAYFNGQVYVGQTNAPSLTFDVSTFASGTIPPGTSYTPTPLQKTPAYGYPDPTYTVSADQNSNGIVWGINATDSNLLAFAASNFTTPIYQSNTVAGDSYTGGVKFGVPTVANGMVYLGNISDTLIGYGLRQSYISSNPAYFSAPQNLSVSLIGGTDAHLSWTSDSSLASEFAVQRSIDDSTWQTIAYIQGALQTYDDTIVAKATDYYRVVAVSGWQTSAPSNIVSTTSSVQLTGLVIGTPGSYKNDGNTIAKAFDGNLSTFFDAPSANGNWVGLDLGSAEVITQIKFASRSGWAARMNGGIFQASNSSTFSSVVNLYTIAANANPPSNVFTTVSVNVSAPYRYVRYLSPTGSYGNVSEIEFIGIPSAIPGPIKLNGDTIGTAGSYKNDGNTIAMATDGNLNTFFDAPTGNGDWVGLDLGTPQVITQIAFAPRSGWANRMVGGVFQASNSANFSTGVVTLYTITTAPTVGVLTREEITAPGAFRYVRYLGPTNSFGNVAEIDFYS